MAHGDKSSLVTLTDLQKIKSLRLHIHSIQEFLKGQNDLTFIACIYDRSQKINEEVNTEKKLAFWHKKTHSHVTVQTPCINYMHTHENILTTM